MTGSPPPRPSAAAEAMAAQALPLAGAGVSASGGRAHYGVRVDGVLHSQWAAWFDGLQVSDDGEETVISGLLADQPALHGLLAKIRDLGLCLISVRLVDTGEAGNQQLQPDPAQPEPEARQIRGQARRPHRPRLTTTTLRPGVFGARR